MNYSTFSEKIIDHTESPMFFGEGVNVSRYDVNRFDKFNKFTDLQQSYFWRFNEVDTRKDTSDFAGLKEHEKFIYLSNISYQTMMDSMQGRAPNVAFLPIVSLPELETWIDTWTFSETIHSRSYTHIIDTVLIDSKNVLDDIMKNQAILKRAGSITKYYDDLYQQGSLYNLFGYGTYRVGGREVVVDEVSIRKSLYRCLVATNALEAIRFYVSFSCSFSFAQRNSDPKMEGCASIMKLIARDETLHLSGTETMINIFQYQEGDLCSQIAYDMKSEVTQIFLEVAQQEKDWAKYLFQHGSLIGLNEEIMCQYVEHLTVERMASIGLAAPFEGDHIDRNPLPWMNGWLGKEDVQKAPQEVTETEYMSGSMDFNYDPTKFANQFNF